MGLIIFFMLLSLIFGLFYDKCNDTNLKRMSLLSSVIAGLLSINLVRFLDFANVDNLDVYAIKHIFTWLNTDNYKIVFNFRYDTVSCMWGITVSVLSAFTCLYASEYMLEAKGKLIALINSFAISMLILVSANDLIQIYFGWELITITSYFLINFYNKAIKNVKETAFRIFTLHKVGDTCLLIAIVLIYAYYDTLNLEKLKMGRRILNCEVSDIATLLMLIAIVIKSAQFGFMKWLKSAMIAPTPASAFLHTATLVSAGLFLLARISCMIQFSSFQAQAFAIYAMCSAIIGAVSALKQNDVKAALACSTISETGIMLASLVLGNYKFAILFFVIHSFAKVSLFFSVGGVTRSLLDERDLNKMGGLVNKFPKLYTSTLLSALFLAGIIPTCVGTDELFPQYGSLYSFFMFAISILTIAYLARIIFMMFHQKPNDHDLSLNYKVFEKNVLVMAINFGIVFSNFIVRALIFFNFYNMINTSSVFPLISKICFLIFMCVMYENNKHNDFEKLYQKIHVDVHWNFKVDDLNKLLDKITINLDTILFKRIYKIIYAAEYNVSLFASKEIFYTVFAGGVFTIIMLLLTVGL